MPVADTQTETRTFEELCRAHIQAFARGAEKYAAETKLSARVNQWQEKLMPLLDEEGERPIFDIRAYGLTVVQSMEQQISRRQLSRKGIEENKEVGHCKPHVSRTVAFGDITRECPSFDVCRLFLAALSLNNSGNISFAPDSTMNSLKMDLLNSDVEGPISSLQGILESDSEMAF